MAESDTILQLGIDAAREGNREEARNLFGLLTRQEPDNLQAWLWLAGVADGPEERRAALERVVELDPTNEMAIKGLQSMGVAPPIEARPPATEVISQDDTIAAGAVASAAAAREMTDEERYAAELDSAFDDYDSLPKAEAPPRPDPDLELEAGAARAATERRAASRTTARRNTPTPVRSSVDDEMRPVGSSDGGGLRRALWAAIAIVGLLLVLFLAYNYINRDRNQTAGTGGGGGQATGTSVPTAELPGGAGGGVITDTASYPSPTGAVTTTGEVAATEGVTSTGPRTATGEVAATGEISPTAGLPPAPQPAAAGDLAKANPAPVAIGTQLSANGWDYTFPDGTYAAVLGSQVGNSTAKGTYVIVLVYVANNTGKDQPLSPDLFVLKDAQGRIYKAQPQVSSAYVQPGVNADISMETAIPANGATTSVALLFDVEHGATNLVLFTSGKTDQGWQVLESVP
jgi:hypothetical protein